ncbi:MAG: DUF881 domain-containing protein [Caldicoprobacterales bacterium]|jgi:uncharacterized protein YlxW (UPF0749 family)|nr:DUF881 domain-containing protein [Clostridiales bacterium]
MKKSAKGQFALTIVSLILGLMLAAQFKNVQKVGGNVSIQRTQELTEYIKKLESDNENLLNQINEYKDIISSYENTSQDETLLNELIRTKSQAGLLPMEGPGVVITVDNLLISGWDGNQQVFQSVHYDDLLRLINELNAAGAEAIAINNERVISTTEIRNAGDYIVINTNRHSAPFEIKAIGNPDNLEAALKLLGGVVDNLSQILDISIKTEERITIPKYEGTVNYRYAEPLQENS